MYFHYLKNVRFPHPGYHPEIIGNVQKKMGKNKATVLKSLYD